MVGSGTVQVIVSGPPPIPDTMDLNLRDDIPQMVGFLEHERLQCKKDIKKTRYFINYNIHSRNCSYTGHSMCRLFRFSTDPKLSNLTTGTPVMASYILSIVGYDSCISKLVELFHI